MGGNHLSCDNYILLLILILKYFFIFLKIVFSIYGLLTFIAVMLLVFPFVLIAALFGVEGGNFIYKICKVWGHIWYITVAIRHKEIYESPHDINKQHIFVANHISYMDIPPAVLAIHQPVRVLGKYEMVRVPIFGWIYKATVILVERTNAEKRAKSVRALKAALSRGISIFIFPEGTFNVSDKPLKEFYDGAFRIAIETQTDIKPILFVDSGKRLPHRFLLSLTPGTNSVVYLPEVSVQGLTMKDLPQVKATVYNIMEDGLLRYK